MGKKTSLDINGHTLQVSNLEKVMYPAYGFNKGNVIDYYIKASPFILPHLKDHPLTLKRYPEGVTGEYFYEKDAPSHTPEWVQRAIVPRKGRAGNIHYVLINDLPSLVWAANLASLEMHIFLARYPKIQQPTSIVFDLDPGEPASILDCAEVAIWIRDLLEQFKLKSFVKASGSKGLQLYIPLNSAVTYEKTQPFARAIAEFLEARHPDRVESQMAKELRGGKVFIDWSQNSEFKTTVSVYSLRAKREQPFVSLPFAWNEIETACRKSDSASLFIPADAALRRLEKLGDLFQPVLTMKQKLPAKFEQLIGSLKLAESVEPDSEPRPKPSSKSKSKPRLKGLGDHSIKAYEAKRDFSQTREPAPEKTPSPGKNLPMFVIQKHQASHLHYDFRLEMDGVLRSWAVPKGPPYVHAEKRLAMWVEDHPLSYARFEGIIAPGNYGAGTVMVWDIGTYEVMDGNFHKGKLHLILHGKKLNGEWILVRARRAGDEEKQPWFLIKGGDSMEIPPDADLSAITGRTMEQITEDADAEWQSNRSVSTTKSKPLTKAAPKPKSRTSRARTASRKLVSR